METQLRDFQALSVARAGYAVDHAIFLLFLPALKLLRRA
jgi:hypothetical protein